MSILEKEQNFMKLMKVMLENCILGSKEEFTMRRVFEPYAKPLIKENLAELGQLTGKEEKINMYGHFRTKRCEHQGTMRGSWDSLTKLWNIFAKYL